jgi:cephalosporin-C deacetylase-like acetyl esterase
MPHTISKKIQVKGGKVSIESGSMRYPGFLRCKVTVSNGLESHTEIATAAFEPEAIEPTVSLPADFNQFWQELKNLHKEVPLELIMTPIKSKSNKQTVYYHVSYQNFEFKNRSYGILTMPRKEGRYPAVIRFPGAGIRPLGGNAVIADKDVITLDIYIHPYPANMESSFYKQLAQTTFPSYMFFGTHDKYAYYYRRVISGCLRGVDLIYSLPQFDGENLAAWGSSQGGALSIITTALDKRIKRLVALCPAMCDFTGYLHDRAGGWPHFFAPENRAMYEKSKVINTLAYYDVVNFARFITVPGFYSWGFNDETTPPTSIYSAYNVIESPKKLHIIPDGRHKIYPEQVEKTYAWILESFGVK